MLTDEELAAGWYPMDAPIGQAIRQTGSGGYIEWDDGDEPTAWRAHYPDGTVYKG